MCNAYTKLSSALRDAGFEVHLPRNLSMNQSRPPNADLYSDSDLIRTYITSLAEAGRDVAVLMHSYGGQVGTNALYSLSKKVRAAKGLPGGITHLIYMAAFASAPNKCMMDLVEEFGHMDRIPVAFDFAEDQSCTPNYPKEGLNWRAVCRQAGARGAKGILCHSWSLQWQGNVPGDQGDTCLS